MRSLVLGLALVLLVGCAAVDPAADAFSAKVSAELEKRAGPEPTLGVVWANGALLGVRVNFDGAPIEVSDVERRGSGPRQ